LVRRSGARSGEATDVPAREPFDVVVSVCAADHAAIWRRGAPNIVRYIAAKAYTVVVPDDEVKLFRRLTPPRIEVVPESRHVAGIAPLLRTAVPAGSDRYGWYLQQFIKLAAIIGASGATALIWDADTIPLRPLRFEDEAGRLLYYTSDERHAPYFEAVERILGPVARHDASFIAQCFPIRTAWARSFAAEVERRSGRVWYEALMAAIDFSLPSGFSEYETLGTHVMNAHSGEFAFHSGAWLRRGSAATGGIERFDAAAEAWLAGRFDHAAFEIWDRPSPFDARTAIRHGARRLLRAVKPAGWSLAERSGSRHNSERGLGSAAVASSADSAPPGLSRDGA
jgi:hypothetical protein